MASNPAMLLYRGVGFNVRTTTDKASGTNISSSSDRHITFQYPFHDGRRMNGVPYSADKWRRAFDAFGQCKNDGSNGLSGIGDAQDRDGFR